MLRVSGREGRGGRLAGAVGMVARHLWGLRRRVDEGEWLDMPGLEGSDLVRNLAEITATNRLLGWTRLTVRYVERLAHGLPAGQPLTVLDVAAGAGDVPRALVTWARRRGLSIAVTAVDLSPAVLAVARRRCATYPEITCRQADARALPWPDRAFDVVLCSLALHHFDPGEAEIVLRELARLARRGIVVPDLERSVLGYLGARVLSLIWRSPLTRHDGPLSVRRSYTPTEARYLLQRAGLTRGRVTRHFPCRMVLSQTMPLSAVPRDGAGGPLLSGTLYL
ncbi:MAG: hypothetical protein NVSMB65_11270 [Chloroflexota bacterium]